MVYSLSWTEISAHLGIGAEEYSQRPGRATVDRRRDSG